MSKDTHQDLTLHEIPKEIIDHDLFAFLKHELARIRDDHSYLASDWPGDEIIRSLVQIASPLFIFAATACRFLEDGRLGDIEEKTQSLLRYQSIDGSQLDKTYLPVLTRLEVGLTDQQKQIFGKKFQIIVGTIVLLEEPLSPFGLAHLLGKTVGEVNSMLEHLHSVLDVPTQPGLPVRLLHLSFRDFLINPETYGKTRFAVESNETHESIALRCLSVMNDNLRQNICSLKSVGALRQEVSQEHVNTCISQELQYACRYWVYHLKHSSVAPKYRETICQFLSKHLPYWLEVMSFLARMSEAVRMVSGLQLILQVRLYLD
jgi:hypothetical protein